MIVALVGGARSGKSRLAVERARSAGDPVVFVATLEPLDEEMKERAEDHRRHRPPAWKTVEAPRELALALRGLSGAGCVIVDCLTLWVSNLLLSGSSPEAVVAAFDGVLEAARKLSGQVVFVSNEVGCGLVPGTPVGRTFRDCAGLVNQRLAAVADEAYFVVAGRMLDIKGGKP